MRVYRRAVCPTENMWHANSSTQIKHFVASKIWKSRMPNINTSDDNIFFAIKVMCYQLKCPNAIPSGVLYVRCVGCFFVAAAPWRTGRQCVLRGSAEHTHTILWGGREKNCSNCIKLRLGTFFLLSIVRMSALFAQWLRRQWLRAPCKFWTQLFKTSKSTHSPAHLPFTASTIQRFQQSLIKHRIKFRIRQPLKDEKKTTSPFPTHFLYQLYFWTPKNGGYTYKIFHTNCMRRKLLILWFSAPLEQCEARICFPCKNVRHIVCHVTFVDAIQPGCLARIRAHYVCVKLANKGDELSRKSWLKF